MKYKIWNKTDTLFTPSGKAVSPEQQFEEMPLSKVAKFIIADAPINCQVFLEFEQTKQIYKQMGVPIVDGMTDQQVLDAISNFEENPPPQAPSVEERTAAALEFLALNSLPEGE
jgi:hypothetical protein